MLLIDIYITIFPFNKNQKTYGFALYVIETFVFSFSTTNFRQSRFIILNERCICCL